MLRKAKILSYIKENPLSTTSEIADRYDPNVKGNYNQIKEDVKQLVRENRTEKITFPPKNTALYITKSTLENARRIMLQIFSSNRINTSRFKQIKYKDYQTSWTFPQVLQNVIALFNLQKKNLLSQKTYKKKTKSEQTRLINALLKREWTFWSWFDNVPKSTDLNDLLKLWEIHIAEEYEQLKFYRKISLRSGKTKTETLVKLMYDFSRDRLDESANYLLKYDYQSKTPAGYYIDEPKKYQHRTNMQKRYILKRLESITDNKKEFDWRKALELEKLERGWNENPFDLNIIKILLVKKFARKEIEEYIMETYTNYEDTREEIANMTSDLIKQARKDMKKEN